MEKNEEAKKSDLKKDVLRLADRLQREGKLPLVEIHILRSTAGELYNRGFNGRHKEITIGGVPRARFSSQSIKHPVRFNYESELECRTRMLPEIIKEKVLERLDEIGFADTDFACDVCNNVIDKSSPKDKKKKKKDSPYLTPQVLAYCEADLDAMVNAVLDTLKNSTGKVADDVKKIREVLAISASVRPVKNSVALFGRFCTDTSMDTIASSVQMNHPFSINPIAGDYDDHSTVDDYLAMSGILLDSDNGNKDGGGAGYLGTTDISSNVYYQYSSVTTRILFENLYRGSDISDERTEEILEEVKRLAVMMIKDYIFTLPTAMQNSMASYPIPSVVYITVGDKVHPLTMDASFERAIIGTATNSVADQGVRRMMDAIDCAANGSFAINDYKGRYWISDLYNDVPDGVTRIAVKDIPSIL